MEIMESLAGEMREFEHVLFLSGHSKGGFKNPKEDVKRLKAYLDSQSVDTTSTCIVYTGDLPAGKGRENTGDIMVAMRLPMFIVQTFNSWMMIQLHHTLVNMGHRGLDVIFMGGGASALDGALAFGKLFESTKCNNIHYYMRCERLIPLEEGSDEVKRFGLLETIEN